ncbi:MAG: hypothetical protein Q9167_001412 [Letrouitia subvulpina]
MSFVLVKNLVFGHRNETHVQQAPHKTEPFQHPSEDKEKPTPLAKVFSERSSDSSWLSCNSSIDLEAQMHQSKLKPKKPQQLRTTKTFVSKWNVQSIKNWRPSGRMISDAIIGLSDGMTVPFALTAGLATIGDSHLVVLGGLAELVAGALSMGLGGWLGARSEAESYKNKAAATRRLIASSSSDATDIVHDVLRPFSVPETARQTVAKALSSTPKDFCEFIMRFHHQEKEPDNTRPVVCALTIGLGYLVGGILPLLPYIIMKHGSVNTALWVSVGIMEVVLFSFGWLKTMAVAEEGQAHPKWTALRGAAEMVIIGSVSAAAAVGLVKAIGGH